MLYLIAEQLGFPGVLNLIRYISFRAGAASATALAIGLLLGPWLISYLRERQGKGQPIRSDGPQSHLAKRGTPTMGGLLILISVAVSVLLWMDLTNPFVWACLLVTAGFGLFVLEAASVIIQVFFYKRTGKRIVRMAPIHHHFEHLGWTESQVVIRFWIISFVLALIGLSSLKLR